MKNLLPKSTDGRKLSDFESIGLLIFYLLFSDSDCFINI